MQHSEGIYYVTESKCVCVCLCVKKLCLMDGQNREHLTRAKEEREVLKRERERKRE